jgi:hypothetical protein
VVKKAVTLRKQFFDVLNHHSINMIVHSETFYEVDDDVVERVEVAYQ